MKIFKRKKPEIELKSKHLISVMPGPLTPTQIKKLLEEPNIISECLHKHVHQYAFAYYGFITNQCDDCGHRWKTKDVDQAFSDKGYIRIPCTCDVDKDHCFHHTDKSICGLCDKAVPSTQKGKSIGAVSWMCDECAANN